MTVVVATLEAMAADRLVAIGFTIHEAKKLFVHEGRVYGSAGDAGLGAIWQRVIEESGEPLEAWPSDAEEESFEGLELGPEGIAYWTRWYARVPLMNRVAAIGSGADVALTALGLGLSLGNAVEEANRRIMGCGRGVDLIELASLR